LLLSSSARRTLSGAGETTSLPNFTSLQARKNAHSVLCGERIALCACAVRISTGKCIEDCVATMKANKDATDVQLSKVSYHLHFYDLVVERKPKQGCADYKYRLHTFEPAATISEGRP
jgi:hypothetical protein